jgi:hypothetical protein
MWDWQKVADVAELVLEEIKDGVSVHLERGEGGNIWEFLSGKTDTLDLKLRIELLEEGDEQ